MKKVHVLIIALSLTFVSETARGTGLELDLNMRNTASCLPPGEFHFGRSEETDNQPAADYRPAVPLSSLYRPCEVTSIRSRATDTVIATEAATWLHFKQTDPLAPIRSIGLGLKFEIQGGALRFRLRRENVFLLYQSQFQL